MKKFLLALALTLFASASSWATDITQLVPGDALSNTLFYGVEPLPASPRNRNFVLDTTIFTLSSINPNPAIISLVSPFPVSKGGTGATVAGGTALDNILAPSGTGLMKRTGAGAWSFVTAPASAVVGVDDSQTLTHKLIDCTQNTCTNFPGGTGGGSGTVTSVATGTGLTGGPITGTGTIAVAAGGIGNTQLASGAGNTVKASLTGSAEVDHAIPDCHAANNALQWTAGTGFGCGTNAAAVSVTAATPDLIVTPSPGTGTFTVGSTAAQSDLSGSGQAIVAASAGKITLLGNFTYTLAQAGTTGFATGWGTCFLNIGSGNATINATTSTFVGGGGTTALVLVPQGSACIASNGANYLTQTSSNIVAGTNVTVTRNTNGTVTVAATGGGGALTCPTNFTASGAECVWTIAAPASTGCSGINCFAFTGLTGNNYTLRCRNVFGGNGTNLIGVQFGEGGTPTWQTGASAYQAQGGYQTSNLAPQAASSGAAGNSIPISANSITTGNVGSSFVMELQGFTSAKNKVATYNWFSFDGSNYFAGFNAAVFVTDTNAITAVRLTDAQGTPVSLSAGSCSLSYHAV